MEERIKHLINYAQGLYRGENGRMLYDKYLHAIKSVTPQEIFAVENEQLKMGLTPKEVLTFVNKLINVCYESLSGYQWQNPDQGTFLYYLMEENKGLLAELGGLKTIIQKQNLEHNKEAILNALTRLQSYNHHLLKLENILFPYLEKKNERFEGLKIMWSLHDEVRNVLKNLMRNVSEGNMALDQFNVEIGQLYFEFFGLVQKQELILFPSATEVFVREEFEEMHLQSFDYPFAFIKAPERPLISESKKSKVVDQKVQMATGCLTLEQVEWMINTLPVDLTFVNADDKVAFFSKPVERIFPRSNAIIGRDVRNCHPPESVHVVEKIIDDFRNNRKNKESFWIQMKDLFILIQYYAVRNDDGCYLGTLEVSQEISGIKELKGEKRLLDD